MLALIALILNFLVYILERKLTPCVKDKNFLKKHNINYTLVVYSLIYYTKKLKKLNFANTPIFRSKLIKTLNYSINNISYTPKPCC